MNLGEMDLEDAAKAAAGNWKTFECFAWHRAKTSTTPTTGQSFTRTTGTPGCSTRAMLDAIEAELDTFTRGSDPDVVAEHP